MRERKGKIGDHKRREEPTVCLRYRTNEHKILGVLAMILMTGLPPATLN